MHYRDNTLNITIKLVYIFVLSSAASSATIDLVSSYQCFIEVNYNGFMSIDKTLIKHIDEHNELRYKLSTDANKANEIIKNNKQTSLAQGVSQLKTLTALSHLAYSDIERLKVLLLKNNESEFKTFLVSNDMEDKIDNRSYDSLVNFVNDDERVKKYSEQISPDSVKSCILQNNICREDELLLYNQYITAVNIHKQIHNKKLREESQPNLIALFLCNVVHKEIPNKMNDLYEALYSAHKKFGVKCETRHHHAITPNNVHNILNQYVQTINKANSEYNSINETFKVQCNGAQCTFKLSEGLKSDLKKYPDSKRCERERKRCLVKIDDDEFNKTQPNTRIVHTLVMHIDKEMNIYTGNLAGDVFNPSDNFIRSLVKTDTKVTKAQDIHSLLKTETKDVITVNMFKDKPMRCIRYTEPLIKNIDSSTRLDVITQLKDEEDRVSIDIVNDRDQQQDSLGDIFDHKKKNLTTVNDFINEEKTDAALIKTYIDESLKEGYELIVVPNEVIQQSDPYINDLSVDVSETPKVLSNGVINNEANETVNMEKQNTKSPPY